MNRRTQPLLLAFLAAALPLSADEQRVPLVLELPRFHLSGTPVPISLPNLERVSSARQEVLVPVGSRNLALAAAVTSSEEPILGDLAQVVDGDKSTQEGSYIELPPGPQWVQVDLGAVYAVHAIAAWHFHGQARAYRAVVVQVSNDPSFSEGVTTVFNSDFAGELGLGRGQDPAYIQTRAGRIFPVPGVRSRYVRFYSNGNTTTPANHYIEIEVYGL